MIYTDPNEVLSPRDSLRNIIEVIHDGGEDSISIVRMNWLDEECLAMRWNVSHKERNVPEKVNETVRCVGMPISRGYPVWIILPSDVDEVEILIEALRGQST